MYAYSKQVRFQEHTRRYSIAATKDGWEVREELDSQLVRQVWYQDWHRVERAQQSFTVRLSELKAGGWSEIGN